MYDSNKYGYNPEGNIEKAVRHGMVVVFALFLSTMVLVIVIALVAPPH
jgi:hypothetical protein